MNFISLFTGIGGFDLGFEKVGMNCIGQSEFDSYANELLKRKWPNVPKLGDVKNVTGITADLICGGFPCQDLSVAGKRAGLAGERSGLWWEFHRIIAESKPTWVVIENVPGLLSSNEGRDLSVILEALAKLGYWWAYRVLNSQYFGVAQRRRRVFIVAHITERTYPAKVLFEPESLQRNIEKSRKARQEDSGVIREGTERCGRLASGKRADGTLSSSQHSKMFLGNQDAHSGDFHIVSRTLLGKSNMSHREDSDTLIAFEHHRTELNETEGHTAPISCQQPPGIAWQQNVGGGVSDNKNIAGTPKAEASHNYQGYGVRRLTPLECERLQGFPDGWTRHGRGEDGKIIVMSDTQRYKQLGNAVTVNVAEWIGKRIHKLHTTGTL